MTMLRTYPNGVTCWIETGQPDPDAAAVFYGGLFGWTIGPDGIAELDGKPAAGIAPGAGPATWTTSIAVDDAERTAAAVVAAGGTMTGTGHGTDPAGAPFRLAAGGPGAQVANVPGAWNFSDLHTPDPAAAMAFYGPIFGWVAGEIAPGLVMLRVPGYGDHLAATVDPGIHERQAFAPPGFADVIGGIVAGEPARWHVTFTVADRDDSVATAERLGAAGLSSSADQWTRKSVLRDPQGAEFTVSQFIPPDPD
jgi:predicted enzyme related to lactoylglutathione lyase